MLFRDQFVRDLRGALVHLYEPRHLSRSPLAHLFGVADRFDTASALQRILIDAIRSLEPPADEPSHSRAWEVYEPLLYRYVEQLGQEEVADQLRLSVRHLRRKERDALEVLADLLWRQYGLDSAGPAAAVANRCDDAPAVSEGLDWLKEGRQGSRTPMSQTLNSVLELADRLAREHHVRLATAVAAGLPSVPADPVAVRQCLLSLLAVAIPRAAGGEVAVSARSLGAEVQVQIQCLSYPSGPKPALPEETASLNVAQELASLSEGRLTLAVDARAFDAVLSLPAMEQLPVLVIDDHADTLQLFQRYTSGTRYRLIPAPDPQQALSLAEQATPRVIVLDVMMPQVDGWEMLQRLQRQPATAGIPIIVCTIVAQREMAHLLGAAAFLKKPVAREAFLAALDRQVGGERGDR